MLGKRDVALQVARLGGDGISQCRYCIARALERAVDDGAVVVDACVGSERAGGLEQGQGALMLAALDMDECQAMQALDRFGCTRGGAENALGLVEAACKLKLDALGERGLGLGHGLSR